MKSELNKCRTSIYPRLIQMGSSKSIYLLTSKKGGTLIHSKSFPELVGEVRKDLLACDYSDYTGSVTLSN